ncbi:hypothetical protein [Mucilaginibacter sp.]|uniref:hypothetical protein n=1 Tax=Mucilaginibacter sp. TaxID=1882438 RepID=UPI003D0D0D60
MLNKNNLFTGVLAALIFPAIACLVAFLLRTNVDIINRPALPYLVAIALNLILVRIGQKKGLDQTIRGIMLATFAIMLVIFLLKVHPIR